MVPSIGFEIPFAVLILGMVVLSVGLVLSGLNAVTIGGMVIGAIGVVGIAMAAAATPHRETAH